MTATFTSHSIDSARPSGYRPPTLEDEDEDRIPPVHKSSDDSRTPDPEQFEFGHTNTGKTLVKPNVRRYLKGARFERTRNGEGSRDDEDEQYTLEVWPKGEPEIVTLMGTANEKEYLNPYTCSASRPGESKNDFHQLDQLDQGGQSFGSFRPGSGSVVYLKKGDDVDTEAEFVSGDAVEYLEYGHHETA